MLRNVQNLNKLIAGFKPQFGNIQHIDLLKNLKRLRDKEEELAVRAEKVDHMRRSIKTVKRLKEELTDIRKVVFYQLGGEIKKDEQKKEGGEVSR